MIHVFLDDYRACPEGFVLARNVEECLLLLRECEVDILSLDFELGPDENGQDVTSAIVREQLYPRRIYLHTSSLWGKRVMYEQLYANKPEGTQLFNEPMPLELLDQIAGEGEQ
ncbi:cell division protein FtsJ [Paenibacillus sp. JX-17]|uniref:Cell division protein FtsJ n=1 Tax=Paenibacillus lacisoli TaxID=3064525 RepID=A0ABT9C7Q4_9BACL|nr:cyclic-phosphate processing receiver domain-containing protein [Paenibacillus sp. JX-17]MDO7904930.1 cell division protein FtsJ [Paenibacillus sp. JX-17]